MRAACATRWAQRQDAIRPASGAHPFERVEDKDDRCAFTEALHRALHQVTLRPASASRAATSACRLYMPRENEPVSTTRTLTEILDASHAAL